MAGRDEEVSEYVRHRLREYAKRGGELKALAEKVGMPLSTPSQVLSGKLGVGPRNVPRFAEAFGMTKMQLLATSEKWFAEEGKALRAIVKGQSGDETRDAVFQFAITHGTAQVVLDKIAEDFKTIRGRDWMFWTAVISAEQRSFDDRKGVEARAKSVSQSKKRKTKKQQDALRELADRKRSLKSSA